MPSVVTIGNFDGVHAGHRKLLQTAGVWADALDLPLVVVTFEPHPQQYFQPDAPFARLTSPQEKIAKLYEYGADRVVIYTFNEDIANMPPENFINEILIQDLAAEHVVVGTDFRFGHKAAGTVSTLVEHAAFTTHVLPLVSDKHGKISSRRLRQP